MHSLSLFSTLFSFSLLIRMSILYEVTLHTPLFADMSDVNANEARRGAGDYERISLTVSATIREMFADTLFLYCDISPMKSWCMTFPHRSCSPFTWPETNQQWIIASYTCSACRFRGDIFHSSSHHSRGFAPHGVKLPINAKRRNFSARKLSKLRTMNRQLLIISLRERPLEACGELTVSAEFRSSTEIFPG